MADSSTSLNPNPNPIQIPNPSLDSGVASSIEVPPLASDSDQGGEWDLLIGKVGAWWSSGAPQDLWERSRSAITIGAALLVLLLILRVYAALLGAFESLPLVPGLLELVGLVWLVRYGAPRLVRSDQRQQLLELVQLRWRAFRGQG